MRKKYEVPDVCGNVRPRWRLLQQHLATGPEWYSVADRGEKRLFTNRSNRRGDDMKDNDGHAWRIWRTARDQLWRLRVDILLVD